MKTTATGDSNITLQGSIEISSISKLYAKLVKCSDRKSNVNLHAEKLTSIDTAGIQLLLTFIKQINKNGNSIVWHQPSQELLLFSERSGLLNELGLSN